MFLAFGYLNFFLNLAVEVWIKIRNRPVVDGCEPESSGKDLATVSRFRIRK
jgi:hypothetical protein